MRSTASSLLASVLLATGGASGGPPVSAAPSWTSTIAEPLRDSSPQALALTQHLKAIEARFYGDWTCPACFKQMNLFGKQAGADLTYVECRKPKQLPEQAKACNAAEIRAYPTWVLPDGRRKVGVQSLEALSRWSGLN
ncbi:vitamin K epoxide reductase [Synechococcus sp. MU1642]|uniref:vitamin K epoxide reductase n=1 Tax=Synechococcus sp. MU1642 TaxID=2508348 RepID=UPI001CF8690E|nr:vitamin K epoxide reductase [Synechococcus sp. MU1642]MCB4408276.1 vitamin K epoxide reductase [Synechococcus sp. MU1642]